jgi:O-antigen/teichoic acid export membrane protein
MAWAVADQIVVSGATFLIGIAAARLLGLEKFGCFTIILVLAGLAQGLHNSTVIVPMMTLSGKRHRRSSHYYCNLMVWNLGLSLLAGIAVALVVGLVTDENVSTIVPATAAYTASQNFHFTVRRLFFAQQKAISAFVLDGTRYVALIVMLIVLYAAGNEFSVEELLWVLAGSAVLSLLPFAGSIAAGRVDGRMGRTVFGRHMPMARWLAAMTLLTFAGEQAITLGLGIVLDDRAVGGLRAGQYLLGATHFIVMAMESFIPGGASRAYSTGGTPALKRFLIQNMLVFGAPTGVLIVLLAVFAEPSLKLVFGPEYGDFATILRIYALSYAFIFVRDVGTHYLRAVERTDLIFRAYMLSAACSAILFAPLVLSNGTAGAALVILASHMVSTAYILAACRRHGAAASPSQDQTR